MRFTCPCCGYKTLEDNQSHCRVCHWNDDPRQFIDPDFEGGKNQLSLRQAQHQFKLSEAKVAEFEKDKNWCPFAAAGLITKAVCAPIRYF